ncbi:multidrug effflux MFS transporter [Croceibacterium aestuarii]|uniref:multidrug effflux MFS transporter n=1 Tax=Croceibacterium aestuarii TaxID=3064139 RepID=UPI00272EBD40|nr:multidrug effflux MFS transporter [Croceibacterium sp. D39]
MATTAPSSEHTIGRRELVVLIALLMSLNALAIDGMLPALDEIAHEFGVAAGNQRQLIVSVYLLANGIGSLVPGAFADRYGRKPVIMIALASYVLFSLIVALSADFTVMLIARGAQGVLAGGLMVAPVALIRDRYEGDQMARMMSMVSAVFIIMPVIAPSLGQAVMLLAGWRWIFVSLAMAAAIAALWTWIRLPETLSEDNRQTIDVPVILRNMRTALFNRASIGYVIGTALLIGAVFGYVNSAQQLIGEHFGAGKWFPVVFGGTAAMMAVSNIVNSRIVTRFGARRVSHSGVLIFIVVSCVQVWASINRDGDIFWFIPLMATNLALLGFLGANFGSIAMQPFANIAGAASSVQTFFRMFGAAMVGMVIGQSYDGTARPFAFALLTCSVLALLLVLYSEKGKLFRRLNKPLQAHVP